MRSGSTVSLVSTASQEYWDKWGKQWLAVVTAFDPQPNEILLVSDVKAELPENIRQIPAVEPFIWESFNHGMREATSDYVGFLGLDDVMPADAFQDLVLEGDVLVSSYIDSKKDIHTPTKERWINCLNDNWFTLDGYRIVHRDIAHLIPHRPIPWADWVASLEYYQHCLDVRFEDRVRYFYNLHDGQQSIPANYEQAVQQIALVKQMIWDGGIKPGSCFPPEPL
jgi:hypothetical protein